jgi:dihydrofolate reductase
MKVKFIAIAALGPARQIGLNGCLPWSIPEEYQHYVDTVKGQYVLVGRKNFELHGSDVAGALPLVLSRTPFTHPKALVFGSMSSVVDYADEMGIEKIYVIGGGEVYNLSLPYLSEFLCSVVDYEGPADTYFPEYMYYEWEMVRQEVFDRWSLYHMRKRPDF